MTRGRLSFLLVSGLLVVSILSGTILGQARSKTSEDSFYKYLSVFSEVLRLVRQAYVDETDLRTLMAGALEGSSDALDPFSFYIPAAEVEAYMTARAIGSGRSGVRVVKLRGAVYVLGGSTHRASLASGAQSAWQLEVERQGRPKSIPGSFSQTSSTTGPMVFLSKQFFNA